MKPIKVRKAIGEAPCKIEIVNGYLPFTVYGERFAVTRSEGIFWLPDGWIATHCRTGTAVGESRSVVRSMVPRLARQAIRKAGKTKLREAIAAAAKLLKL